jgi:acetylornithine deacetylase/succinyl-diaminopimelate desuccinylase-like protein
VRVDIRYGDSSEVERIQKALKEVLVSDDPKIEIEVVETLFYPSFDVNEKAISFADEVIEIGEKLGLKIRKQKRSSGSEANWISTANPDCIVLDGFGVIGGGDHSTEEYFFIDTLQHSIDLGSETVKHILNI